MKIFITGAAGFVGSRLTTYLLERGHRVIAVGRTPAGMRTGHENYRYIAADTTRPGPWQETVREADAIVNLAGKSIFKRWNKRSKQQIYDSRILTTRNLVDALPTACGMTLCSASGAGYYGNRGEDILKEDAAAGRDFLARLSADWEKEALAAAVKGARVVTMRFGIILGRNGGAMAKMIPAYRFFLGGPMGSGRQWFAWIHLEDLMVAIMFVLENRSISGPVNFCAPHPVRNRELAKALGRVLRRPAVVPAPAFFIRLALGEFGRVLLFSQRAVPEKLLQHGFQFRYPDILGAAAQVAGQPDNSN